MKNYYDIIKELGLTRFKEQEGFLTNSLYDTTDKIVGLFLATDGGKTTTAIIKLIQFYSVLLNAKKRSIVFPAARAEVRDNMQETLAKYNNDERYFTWGVASNTSELNKLIDSDKQVIIVLPQCANYLKGKELPKIDGWMIFDEAHEWYNSPTVQRLLQVAKPRHQMLMTGSPFDFNGRDDIEGYYISVEEQQDSGKSGDATMITVSSAYNFRDEDYLDDDELRADVDIETKATIQTLEKVIKEMLTVMKCKFASNAKLVRLTGLINKIKPTAIYARNRKMGNDLYNEMKRLGLDVVYSDSEVDPKADLISDFKNGKHQFIIVVDRMKQGFSYNELCNIVDMTLTSKPSVLVQMFGRLLRKSILFPNIEKRYFKVAPKNEVGYIEHVMWGVLQLLTKTYYSVYSNNPSELPLPVIERKKRRGRPRKNEVNKRNTTRRPKFTVLQSMTDAGISLNLSNLKSIRRNDNKYFQITRVMKMKDAKWMLKNKSRATWTVHQLKEVRDTQWVECKTQKDCYNINYNAAQAADRKGLLKEWFPASKRNTTESDWKVMFLDDKGKPKYSTRTKAKKAHPGAYDLAKDAGFIDKHYPKHNQSKQWTLSRKKMIKYTPEIVDRLIQQGINEGLIYNRTSITKYKVKGYSGQTLYYKYIEYLKQGRLHDYWA